MADERERIHQTWIHSDRAIPSRFVRPLVQFTHVEAAGGIVLLIATIAALIWANAGSGESYQEFWHTHVSFSIGSFHFDESLKHIVNDGLMAIFFFVVALEIKRELVVGELRDRKRAALPAVAALGGMILPALIYVFFVMGTGGEALQGWGIPMATDIAFSVGVLSLLGSRISVGAKLFLLALAIADDVGAIAVIAVFYSDDLNFVWLATSFAVLVGIKLASRIGIRSMGFYLIFGVVAWFFMLESGVHATIAGVAMGFLTPVHAMYSDKEYYRISKWIINRYDMDSASPRARERVDHDALELSVVARESVSPLDRLELALHPWSSFVIIPIFALANAGVRFVDIDLLDAAASNVALGVAAGLVVGKAVGITAATYLAVKFGIGKLPARSSWTEVLGLATLAGIGFTVSLFITELAFTDPQIVDRAKIGIFIGSTVAGVVGYLVLRRSKTPEEELEAGRVQLGISEAPTGT